MFKVFVLSSLLPFLIYSKTWYIDTAGVEGDSLQKYINIAHDSSCVFDRVDTVLVSEGRYNVCINADTGLIMRDSVYLRSNSGAQACTLDAVGLSDTSKHVIFCWFGDSSSQVAVIEGFTIRGGNANGDILRFDDSGGGIYCYESSPLISNNIITDNTADFHGGGVFCESSLPRIEGNIIFNNRSVGGGGVSFAYCGYGIFENNDLFGNIAEFGGGMFCGVSSPDIFHNVIRNNLALGNDGGGVEFYANISLPQPKFYYNEVYNNFTTLNGGGIYSFEGNCDIRYSSIFNNYANHHGGAFCVFSDCVSSIRFCTILGNYARISGGAIYVDICHFSSLIDIDSCFIADNGSIDSINSGLAGISTDASNYDHIDIAYSNLYYNTFQPDIEICNAKDDKIRLENNFWNFTDSASIQNLIKGPADIIPFSLNLISGVPGEPIEVDSINVYSDSNFSVICDTLLEPDTLYVRLYGENRTNNLMEPAIVIIKSDIFNDGIANALIETDTNSGVYQGKIYVIESSGTDTIRIDDIYQRVKVNPLGDLIRISANSDTTVNKNVIYKSYSGIEADDEKYKAFEFLNTHTNTFINKVLLEYQLTKKSKVSLYIVDIVGRHIRNLVDKEQDPGKYRVSWHFDNENGTKVSSGVFFCVAKSGNIVEVKKIVRLK